MCMCVYEHVHMHKYMLERGAFGGQEKLLYPLELDLSVVVSYPIWMLGTKLGSSAKVARTVNHEPSPQPPILLLLFTP